MTHAEEYPGVYAQPDGGVCVVTVSRETFTGIRRKFLTAAQFAMILDYLTDPSPTAEKAHVDATAE